MAVVYTIASFISSNVASILVFTIVFLFVWYYFQIPSNLPPGPPALPIIGSLPFTGLLLHNTFLKWRPKYGDIASFYLGNEIGVILNNYDVIKEAFVKHGDATSGRQRFDSILKSLGYQANSGILISEGPAWKEQRRFVISTLRDFGMGKHSLEGKIQEEITSLTDEIKKQNGQECDIHLTMNNAISNIICSIIFGRRFEYSDKEFLEILDMIDKSGAQFGRSIFLSRLPWVEHWPGDPAGIKYLKAMFGTFQAWVKGYIDSHRLSFNQDNILDLIDAYLYRMKENEKAGVVDSHIDEINFTKTIFDLFFAGSETTSTTLRWFILYMVLYPEVQRNIQEEIDNNVPKERLPSLHDRQSLPYTESVLQEITRLCTIVPMALPHRVTKPISLKGYLIPEGALILPNIWAVHMDPENFPDPTTFKPDRFLSEDRKKVVQSDHLLQFGIGRRICAGESLARMELFLFSTGLLQQFTFKLPDGAPRPDPTRARGLNIRSPPQYSICAAWREHDD